jgi:hypothetical protein
MSKQHYDHNDPNIANKPTASNQPGVGNNAKGSDLGDQTKDSGMGNQNRGSDGGAQKEAEKAMDRIKSTVDDISSKAENMSNENSNSPQNKDKREGKVAKEIEDKTARIPSDAFLWTSFACMGVSLTLKLMKQNKTALFVGQWATPFLLMGVYNKIVKTQGSE